jgi:hypothetical protein
VAVDRAAALKPKGLSWGLVLCIAAIIVGGALAFISRPQIDDGAAYYFAAGVLIFAALWLERRDWLRLSSWRWLLVAVLVSVPVYRGIVEAYWYASYQVWKLRGPGQNPSDPTVEDILTFNHAWCGEWSDHVWHCWRNPDATWRNAESMSPYNDEALWSEVRVRGAVICKRLARLSVSMRRIQCVSAGVPAWCRAWWDGGKVRPNPPPEWSAEMAILGGDPAYRPALPGPDYPGECYSTRWD